MLAAAVAAAGPDGQLTQYLAGAVACCAGTTAPAATPMARRSSRRRWTRPGWATPAAARRGRAGRRGLVIWLASRAAGASRRAAALAWAGAELLRRCAPRAGAGSALSPRRPGRGRTRIAGYLDQYGRRTRQDQLVPASLWGALIAGSAAGSAGDLARVAQAVTVASTLTRLPCGPPRSAWGAPTRLPGWSPTCAKPARARRPTGAGGPTASALTTPMTWRGC